jgi:hypothetical protein
MLHLANRLTANAISGHVQFSRCISSLVENLQVMLRCSGLGSWVSRRVSGGCRVIRRSSPGDPAVTGLTGGSDRVDGVFWYTKHIHYTLVWI